MTAVPVMHERMRAGDFLALPERDDARRLELVDGEVVVSEPTMLHNVVQVAFLLALGAWIEAGEERGRVCVPLDVGLDDRNVFVPDVSWYSSIGAPDVNAPRPYPVPDLAIEIRSPSTWVYDIGAKRAGYERRGLPSCGWSTLRPSRYSSSGARRPAGRGSMSPWSWTPAKRRDPHCCQGSGWRSTRCFAPPRSPVRCSPESYPCGARPIDDRPALLRRRFSCAPPAPGRPPAQRGRRGSMMR